MINNPNLAYVGVCVFYDRNGRATPMSITWEDGRVYEIARAHLDGIRATDKGGVGWRYTIVVDGQQRYLFQEDKPRGTSARWFVERN